MTNGYLNFYDDVHAYLFNTEIKLQNSNEIRRRISSKEICNAFNFNIKPEAKDGLTSRGWHFIGEKTSQVSERSR